MAKFNDQKIYEELGKLSPKEQAIELKKISEFVTKNLESESSQKQEEADELQKIIKEINGK